jgi:hypothetical protein
MVADPSHPCPLRQDEGQPWLNREHAFVTGRYSLISAQMDEIAVMNLEFSH